MAKRTEAGRMRILSPDGQDISAKVARLQIGDLQKALADLTDEDVKALRGGTTQRMPDKSSKEIICTMGCEDAYSGPDADF